MVNRHFLIAATASVALFSGVAGAFAQPPGPPQFGGPQFTNAQPPQGQQGPGGRGGQRQGDPALRGQRLHQQLNITPNQEQAFNAWIAATAAPAGPPNDQGTTTPQKLDRRLADLTARVNAAKRFYGVLTPEQKQIFDGLPSEVALGQPGPGAGRGGQLAHAAQAQGKGAGKAARQARRNGVQNGVPNGPPPPQPGGYNPQ